VRRQNLRKMGLAEDLGRGAWLVGRDFQNVLRTMQQIADRQKMLARHGALMSDPRLLMQVTDLRKLKVLERRVLLHGEDEQTGRPYMFVKVSTRRFTLSITRPRSLRPERRPVAIELVRPAAAAVPERPASAAGGGSRVTPTSYSATDLFFLKR
jgi:hypothetical protein